MTAKELAEHLKYGTGGAAVHEKTIEALEDINYLEESIEDAAMSHMNDDDPVEKAIYKTLREIGDEIRSWDY